MTTVYRIETANGVGMYNCNLADCITNHMQPWSAKGHRHPTHRGDSRIAQALLELGVCEYDLEHKSGESFIFGFKTKTQIRKWVWKKIWRKGLAESGLILNRHTLVKGAVLLVGEAQCIFLRSQIQKTEPLDLMEL